VRVVLAERRRTRRVVRTLAEVEKQTAEGEELLRRLVRDQLSLAIRRGGLTVAVLGSLPLAFALVPSLGAVEVLGLRLPWLVLGVAVYPFLLAVAWSYNRNAEYYEQEFAEMVES
jgi:Flp pilus assembly protein TadB